MSKMSAKKVILFSLITIFFIFLLIIPNVKFLFDESVEIEKGNYKFYLLIENEIKNLPLLKPIENTIKYWYGMGDGLKPTVSAVMFNTRSKGNEIISFYENHFTGLGYQKDDKWIEPYEMGIVYSRSNGYFKLIIDKDETLPGINHVTIDHWK